MKESKSNKTKKESERGPASKVDLTDIVERKKLQNKVLKKMIEKINNNTNEQFN